MRIVSLFFSTAALWALASFTLLGAEPGTTSVPVENPTTDGQWTPLFNGKDLTGWLPKIRGYELNDNFADTFRVEDGLLKVRYDKYDRFDRTFGHLIFHRPFSDYRLRVEYRFVGEQVPGGPGWAIRNSGIMLHGQPPKTIGKDQDFPVSVEVQLLGGLGTGRRPTANVCTPGTNIVLNGKLTRQHCIRSKSKTYHGDQWVTVEVEVRNAQVIKHIVEGEIVLEYTEPQLDPSDPDAKPLIKDDQLLLRGGYISLQSESHPIDFRKVEIQLLAPQE